eukprot:6462698-Amphidinium_carterae.1
MSPAITTLVGVLATTRKHPLSPEHRPAMCCLACRSLRHARVPRSLRTQAAWGGTVLFNC